MIKTCDLHTLEVKKKSVGRPRKNEQEVRENRKAYMREYQSRPERRAYQREYQRARRASETEAERKERLRYDRLYRSCATAEQREARNQRQREYRARKKALLEKELKND
tara:strand:+ start:283 stop:609 length:327 start_codon:yes stop_codon:yes gene_type:complete